MAEMELTDTTVIVAHLCASTFASFFFLDSFLNYLPRTRLNTRIGGMLSRGKCSEKYRHCFIATFCQYTYAGT